MQPGEALQETKVAPKTFQWYPGVEGLAQERTSAQMAHSSLQRQVAAARIVTSIMVDWMRKVVAAGEEWAGEAQSPEKVVRI